MENKDQGAAAPQRSALSPDDHPGGPLSRAERVVLSHLKGSAMRARAMVGGMSHVLGAIPGAQKIDAAHAAVVDALDRLLEAMKTRKEGAPYPAWQQPAGDEEASAASPAEQTPDSSSAVAAAAQGEEK